MFALRAKEKLIALDKKDREKKGKRMLERKKDLQKFHAGLSPGDPRIGIVKRPNADTAAKRDAKYVGTFSVQQDNPTLNRIKQIISQQVSRIDFQQPPSVLPVAIVVSVEGVKVLSHDGKRLIMAHALKRILFTMVNDKHTAFILVARNPDSPQNICHCHVFMAASQTEASNINELVGNAFKLAFANKRQQHDKKQRKPNSSNMALEPAASSGPANGELSSGSAGLGSNSVNNSGSSNYFNSSEIHDESRLRGVEERHLKETIDRLDQEVVNLNIANFDLESYFSAYESDKGSDQYLKALAMYEMNKRVISQKSIILERMHSQYRQLLSDDNENLTANRNTNNVLIPPPVPRKKNPRSGSSSPVSEEPVPPPLPPKSYHKPAHEDSPPPIPPHTHSKTDHVSKETHPLPPPPPPVLHNNDQRLPRPYEIPISKYDRMHGTLTSLDAPVPPGYEFWEPEFEEQQSGTSQNVKKDDFVLRDAEWFQSGIPREIAEEILRQEGEGCFIVRSSQSNLGCYALSMKGPNGLLLNFLIEKTSKGVFFQGDEAHTFPNLVALIVHHSVVPGILPCPLAVTKSNPLFDVEDDSSDEDPDYKSRSEILKLFN